MKRIASLTLVATLVLGAISPASVINAEDNAAGRTIEKNSTKDEIKHPIKEAKQHYQEKKEEKNAEVSKKMEEVRKTKDEVKQKREALVQKKDDFKQKKDEIKIEIDKLQSLRKTNVSLNKQIEELLASEKEEIKKDIEEALSNKDTEALKAIKVKVHALKEKFGVVKEIHKERQTHIENIKKNVKNRNFEGAKQAIIAAEEKVQNLISKKQELIENLKKES